MIIEKLKQHSLEYKKYDKLCKKTVINRLKVSFNFYIYRRIKKSFGKRKNFQKCSSAEETQMQINHVNISLIALTSIVYKLLQVFEVCRCLFGVINVKTCAAFVICQKSSCDIQIHILSKEILIFPLLLLKAKTHI